MKIIKLCVILVITLFLQGCPDDPDMYYRIQNNSESDIFCLIVLSDRIVTLDEFPQSRLTTIKANNAYEEENWSYSFKACNLYILIFKKSTLDAYSWEEIQEKNLYDKRYVLSLEELKAMNYTVVYDGK